VPHGRQGSLRTEHHFQIQQIDLEMSEDTKKKPEGLGDTIAEITRATRIKNIVDHISNKTGKDCGCAKRQKALNKMFPYSNK